MAKLAKLYFKGATSRTMHLEKIGNFFKFVDCNRSLSSSVEAFLGYFCVFIYPLVFSMLENYYFEVSFNFKVIRKMTKHRDIAPLNSVLRVRKRYHDWL